MPWHPEGWSLTTHVGKTAEYLKAWAETASTGTQIRFTKVAQAIGMKAADFRNDVRSHEAFRKALVELGITEVDGQRLAPSP
jgi:hypothetical protein